MSTFILSDFWGGPQNKKIKDGEGGDLLSDKPNKKRQKDIDASWAQKGGLPDQTGTALSTAE